MNPEKTFKATIHLGSNNRNTKEVYKASKAFEICQQYPRFPREDSEILNRALDLANQLMQALNQYKVLIITNNKTYMLENKAMESIDPDK